MGIKANLPRKYKWKGNLLQKEAEMIRLYPIDEKEILRRDMTSIFLEEIEREIVMGEIIKIQINGKPRLGKSTVGISLGYYILRLLQKYYMKFSFNKTKFDMRNIARDEQEWAKKMRDPDRMYDIIVIDEKNKLEGGGENATVEQNQREVFSDVQAGRYIHGVYICPEGEMDTNADIKLIVRNKQDGFNHCRLFYKLEMDWQLIGTVDFDTSKLIQRWEEEGKELFFSWQKKHSEELWQRLKEIAVKDFYVEYMVKKYEKMELMNREGILRPRELDYAKVYLTILGKTKRLVNAMSINQMKNIIFSYIEMEFKKEKIPYTMVGIENSLKRLVGILTTYKSLKELADRQMIMNRLYKKGKITEQAYLIGMEELMNIRTDLENAIKIQEDELVRYSKINEKYHSEVSKW